MRDDIIFAASSPIGWVHYTKALRKQDCIGVQTFAVRFTKHKIKFVYHYIYHVGKYMYKVRVDVDPMWPCVIIFIFILFQIYLYRVNHSVTLFFHGALLQSKIHKYKEHIYTHS